jgi:hypothetical protein
MAEGLKDTGAVGPNGGGREGGFPVRRFISAFTAVLALSAPSHAAWVWVYGGERHVLMPPEEGRPPWADYPDADGNGQPDPIITKVELRIEDEDGQAVSRTRLGRTIRLVATPELGGMELEPLNVQFRLAGPVGEVEVDLDEALRNATVVGAAPATYTAHYSFPEPPAQDFVGDWQASVAIKVGAASLDTTAQPVALKVLGPRESTPEKVGRQVSGGLRQAGRHVREFGSRIAGEVEEWLAQQREALPPGALRDVQPRQTLGMVDRVLKAPGSPLAAEGALLAVERAAALRSRGGPQRSLLVVPLDAPAQPIADRWFPLGYAVMSGLRPPGVADLQTLLPWACDGCVRAGRIVLEAEPGSPDGSVHFEAADGSHFVTVPAQVEWVGKVLFPGQTELRVTRHPTEGVDGLVDVRLISAVPGGAARVDFTLPLVPVDEPEAAPASPAPTDEGTPTNPDPT